MADHDRRRREFRYKIDGKFGYKPDKDPPRTPPTSARSGGDEESGQTQDKEKLSEDE